VESRQGKGDKEDKEDKGDEEAGEQGRKSSPLPHTQCPILL